MNLSNVQLDARYASLTAVAAGYLPSDRAAVDEWHTWLRAELERTPTPAEWTPAVGGLETLMRSDGIVRMYVAQMIEQALKLPHEAEKPDLTENTQQLLEALNLIVSSAPVFAPKPPHGSHAFPMSNLFVYMMMTTAGEAAFRLPRLNEALRAILKEWCEYLDSPASAGVLNDGPEGWLSGPACEYNKLDEFEIPDRSKPHWGWQSYNDFFHREIKASARPIGGPEDPKAIVSANDGILWKIAREVKSADKFWLKGQPYSLSDMLCNDRKYVDLFTGGDVFQTFLSGANYHRWHSPIAGVVQKVELVEALLFSDLEAAGYDIGAGTESLGYEASVNTRGLVYVESDDPKIGTVCVIPIGITEISSISFSVSEGDRVTKGQELGRFSYGGSTLALVFQPGAVNRFTVAEPSPQSAPAIEVNAQIAVAS